MSAPVRSLLLALLLAAPLSAQEGLYTVTGTDGALGPYSGTVELRAQSGGGFRWTREVTFQNQVQGRSLTTIWDGTATPGPNGLDLRAELRRFGWITAVGNLRRTAADNQPLVVTGLYRPDASGGYAGALQPAGVVASEVLVRQGSLGAAPLFTPEVRYEPLHGAPPGWIKWILFRLFSNYHGTPAIARWASDPRFQAAVHLRLIDRTGFAWLRAHPQSRLLYNSVVDEISLAEAELRRSAYGQTLREKAALYDQQVETRLRDVTGLLAAGVRQGPNGPEYSEDMSTFLWSACYTYAQACRYQVTSEPQALQNVASMAEVLCDLILEVDPRPGEFARSMRPLARAPLGGSWHAGTGRFANMAWHDNGNNDMVKGVWIAFLGAWRVLPANHPLRPRIQDAVREIADAWATSNPSGAGGTGHRRDSANNRMLNNMLAFWITGERRYEDAYKRALRNPILLLDLLTGANIHAWGIADWSGTHLGIVTRIATVELGRELRSSWGILFEQSIRGGHHFLKEYWRTTMMWSVGAAGYLGQGNARVNVHLGLQEWPFPKPGYEVDRELDANWCPSPLPSLPWKMDWMNQNGYARRQGLISYPTFMSTPSNYQWRSGPLSDGNAANPLEQHGADYLFAYWVGRKLSVIGPND